MNASDQAAEGARPLRIEPLTRLATGGMADIWLARELGAAGLERFVVVKRLLPHLARDPEVVEMFISEARFVARLVHPNVVQIHELGQDDDGYFLVMEYVAGCSVRELMLAADKAARRLPPEVAVCVIEQACRGAHAAHELTDPTGEPLGLVHRDISPHNLMIGPGGDVKLLDFGIAKATAAAEATRTGSLKGKQGYMSPEQCRAQRIDRRCDVFALGIVLWELLVGKRLFKREADFASMQAIVSGDFQLPSDVNPAIPAAFDSVVARALATDVELRWQTAEALRRGLLNAAEDADLRPSRDALGATLVELLGDRLDRREDALRAASSETVEPIASALRAALVHSEPSLERGSDASGDVTHGSDDVATVVHRRPAQSSAPPSASHSDAAIPAASVSTPPDDQTLLQASAPGRAASGPGEGESKRRVVRWLLLALALVAAAVVVLVATTRPTQHESLGDDVAIPSETSEVLAQPTGPPLRLVVAPTIEPDVIRSELAPFTVWLAGEVNRPVEIIVADSYQHSSELLTSGGAELGLLPPLLFVQSAARESRLQPLVLRLFDGSRASDGYLLVRDDAPLQGADGLRGKAVCLVDRESTTGFLLPRIWMRAAELDPDKDVRTIFSGDHLSAVRDLSEGRCDAAAVYSGAYLSAQEQGIRVGATRVLAITGRVPQDVVVAAPSMPEAEAAQIRDRLLGFEPQRDVNSARLGAVLGISGFAKYDAAEFDLIREAAEREGLISEPAAVDGGG